MTFSFKRTLIVAVVAFLAALAGVMLGRELWGSSHKSTSELHEVLHNQLNLDSQQLILLEDIEAQFAMRRRALELELRADNTRLAAAIQKEHGNGPQVAASVDKSHATMGELQKETLAHIFAMRKILRPDQMDKFDRAVVQALTKDAR